MSNRLTIALFLTCFSFVVTAQDVKQENEQRIKEMQEQIKKMSNQLEEDSVNLSTQEDDELKLYLQQILAETRKTNEALKNSNAQPNASASGVVIYVKELQELREQNEALRAELNYLKKQMVEMDARVTKTERTLATSKGNNAYSPNDLEMGALMQLNQNLERLSLDLNEIKVQNEVSNDRLEILTSSGIDGSLKPKVEALEKTTEEIKEKVESLEEKSKYIVLESTRESITNPESMQKQDLPLGYYLIIDSERSYKRMVMKQKTWSKQGIESILIQNKTQTWYHLYTKRLDTRQEAGAAVTQARKSGISDAWWLKN